MSPETQGVSQSCQREREEPGCRPGTDRKNGEEPSSSPSNLHAFNPDLIWDGDTPPLLRSRPTPPQSTVSSCGSGSAAGALAALLSCAPDLASGGEESVLIWPQNQPLGPFGAARPTWFQLPDGLSAERVEANHYSVIFEPTAARRVAIVGVVTARSSPLPNKKPGQGRVCCLRRPTSRTTQMLD